MVDSLNEELVAEYKASFDLIDADRDGSISIKELKDVMDKLGQNFSSVEVEEMINEVDLDGSESVDFKEFLALMTRKIKDVELEDELLEAFKIFDRDGNGYITLQNLTYIISRIDNNVTEKEVEEMMKEADLDKDGKISFDEFIKLMKNF